MRNGKKKDGKLKEGTQRKKERKIRCIVRESRRENGEGRKLNVV